MRLLRNVSVILIAALLCSSLSRCGINENLEQLPLSGLKIERDDGKAISYPIPVGRGDALRLRAYALVQGNYIDVSGRSVWSSDDSVARVNMQGDVQASRSDGVVTISAEYGGYSAVVRVEVRDPREILTGLTIEPASPEMDADGTQQFTARGSFREGPDRDVSGSVIWSSSSVSVAVISTSGLATGQSGGTTTIRATMDGITGSTDLIVNDPVRSIQVSPAHQVIQLNGIQQYGVEATRAGGAKAIIYDVVWTSSAVNVAAIDEGGLARAGTEEGTTTITATYGEGISHSATLVVSQYDTYVTGIVISAAKTSLDVPETAQFTALVSYSDGSTVNETENVTWRSSGDGIASINPQGLATAHNEGSAVISASFRGVTSNDVTLMVADPMTALTVTPLTAEVARGQSRQFTATAYFASGNNQTVAASWTSGDEGVATVDANGLATAVAYNGETDITAAWGGRTGSAILTVSTAATPTGITISPSSATIDADGSKRFTATVTWDSKPQTDETVNAVWSIDNGVAIVTETRGLFAGRAAGTGTVTASFTANGTTVSATAGLSVNNPLRTIMISPASATIDADGTQPYMATGNYADGTMADITSKASWSSSNTNAAVIGANGVASGKKAGNATIKAILDGITSNESLLTVEDPLRSIVISPSSATISDVESRQFSATGIYASGLTADLTSQVLWDSTNTEVATINSSGLASAVLGSEGTATISADYGNGAFTDTATLTVSRDPAVPTSIVLSPSPASMAADGSVQFTATVEWDKLPNSNETDNAQWSVSDGTVAAFSGVTKGKLEGKKGGEVIVTVSFTSSGVTVTGTASVTVSNPLRSIAVSLAEGQIAADETTQCTAIGSYADGTTANITASVAWSSSNEAVATVGEGGLAEGVSSGVANIGASLSGVSGNQVVLTVTNPLRGIQVTPLSETIDLSVSPVTRQFTATGTYADGTTANITSNVVWTSSNGAIATVESGGIATGISEGTVDITASLSGLSAAASLSVTDPVVSLSVSPSMSSVVVGNSRDFTATAHHASTKTAEVTGLADWNSSNTAIVTVSGGTATAQLIAGSVEISATFEGKSGTAVLEVTNPVTGIEVSPETAQIDKGQTRQFSATAIYANGDRGTVTAQEWTSSDDAIATVDSSGLALGVGPGTATIIASFDGYTGSAELTVIQTESDNADLSGLWVGRGTGGTQMDLYSAWKKDGGTKVAFSGSRSSHYAYLGGIDRVRIRPTAADGKHKSITVNGTTVAGGATHTVVFTAQGINTVNIVVTAEDNSTKTYTVYVNFLTIDDWYKGVVVPYFGTSYDKWNQIVPNPDVGLDKNINGNLRGYMRWFIKSNYSLACGETTADEAAVALGKNSNLGCGASGLFAGWNWMKFFSANGGSYNDGNAYYSGTQDGNSWSGNWDYVSVEGGLTMSGDMAAKMNLEGTGIQLGIINVHNSDGVNIGRYIIHYDIYKKEIKEGSTSFTRVVYMPGTSYEQQKDFLLKDENHPL